jgi:hypothetical protein
MTKNGKILLGCGGVLIIGIIVVLIVGYFAMNYVEKNLVQGVRADMDAGEEFAKTTDQKGCMTEGLKRSKTMGFLNVGQGMSLSSFVESCLKGAKPTDGFCTGVPGFWSFEKDEWITEQCRQAGLDKEKTGCFFVFAAKHNVCSPPA